MNNLLDTHTLTWFITGDPGILDKAKKEIETKHGDTFVSIASIWIKISVQKLHLETTFEIFIDTILQNSFKILPVTLADTITISSLPIHHRDPFDRMIIAQAQNLNLQIVTKDSVFKYYNVPILW